MKKTLFGSLVAFVLAIGLASCGEKLLTPEQVEAEINKGVEAGMPAVKTTEDANCEASFEARVTAEVERMKAESTQTVQ